MEEGCGDERSLGFGFRAVGICSFIETEFHGETEKDTNTLKDTHTSTESSLETSLTKRPKTRINLQDQISVSSLSNSDVKYALTFFSTKTNFVILRRTVNLHVNNIRMDYAQRIVLNVEHCVNSLALNIASKKTIIISKQP